MASNNVAVAKKEKAGENHHVQKVQPVKAVVKPGANEAR